jgi:hypothetical protein
MADRSQRLPAAAVDNSTLHRCTTRLRGPNVLVPARPKGSPKSSALLSARDRTDLIEAMQIILSHYQTDGTGHLSVFAPNGRTGLFSSVAHHSASCFSKFPQEACTGQWIHAERSTAGALQCMRSRALTSQQLLARFTPAAATTFFGPLPVLGRLDIKCLPPCRCRELWSCREAGVIRAGPPFSGLDMPSSLGFVPQKLLGMVLLCAYSNTALRLNLAPRHCLHRPCPNVTTAAADTPCQQNLYSRRAVRVTDFCPAVAPCRPKC